jgi:hypothetical protein
MSGTPQIYPDNGPGAGIQLGRKRKLSAVHILEKSIDRLRRLKGDSEGLTINFKSGQDHQISKDILFLLDVEPEKAHELAEINLRCFPKPDLSTSCWARVHSKAVHQMINNLISITLKELEMLPQDLRQSIHLFDQFLSKAVEILDRGLLLTGLPGILPWAHKTLQEFSIIAEDADAAVSETRQSITDSLRLTVSPNLPQKYPSSSMSLHPPLKHPVRSKIMDEDVGIFAFQTHLAQSHYQNNRQGPLPLVILNGNTSWATVASWESPAYLMQLTLGGRRLVPVEIGRSYTDSEWTQKIMSFHEFITKYMLVSCPATNRGYLAQHDLSRQIPSIVKDFPTPDFCYSEPPYPAYPDPKSKELEDEEAKLSDNVERNIWLGPAHTVSPAHTDPYHNILAQVVGEKYVRLYAPDQKQFMYPRGVEDGINMSNTSLVDVGQYMRAFEGWAGWDKADEVERYRAEDLQREIQRQFPSLKKAQYMETILRPGQMLYLPKGWWHYCRSLSPSISMSFWWK